MYMYIHINIYMYINKYITCRQVHTHYMNVYVYIYIPRETGPRTSIAVISIDKKLPWNILLTTKVKREAAGRTFSKLLH